MRSDIVNDSLKPTRNRSRGSKPLALSTAAAVVLGSLLCAPAAVADTQATESESAAHGHGLFVEGLGLDVAGSARANSSFPDAIGANMDDLQLSVLNDLIDLNLGTVALPLIKSSSDARGLLELGGLGALSSYAKSSSATSSTSSSGIINDDGALAVDDVAGENFEPAELDASALLAQLLGEEVASSLLDQASIKIGALGSTVTETAGQVDSQYAIADLQVDVHSPVVGNLVTGVDETLQTSIGPLTNLLQSGGAIETLVSGVVSTIGALPLVNASLSDLSIDTEPLLTSVRTELLATPLSNADGSIKIDLKNGTIHVDLEKVLLDSTGSSSLNTLPADTQVLSGDVVTSIVDGVSDVLLGSEEYSLVSKVGNLVTEGIYELELNVDILADISIPIVGELVKAPVTVKGTLGGFVGQEGAAKPVVDTSQINVAGIPVGTVLQPIINALNGLVTSIGGVLTPAITNVLEGIQPALTGAVGRLITPVLDQALEPVLNDLVNITINEQPDQGDLGPESFTVRALSIDVLPTIANVGVDLGSSTVLAADSEAAVTISSPTADQKFTNGDPVVVSGKGEPGKTITVTVDGDAGTAKSVVVDASGDWSTSFEGLDSGVHTVVATDGDADDESTAEVSFEVQDAAGADSAGAEAGADSAGADASVDAASAADAEAGADSAGADANADAQADAASAADAEAGADSAGADASVEANVDANVDA
ncbi:choice-of-anchor G family protein, partial [Glutamicibacter protophormiae]